ncbi:hypothetical protein [Niveibacterium sp. SC-1]|uniref:hypothetical protein n=1 Tax=Niveibacterium sp. SC-1 TaxID=3135646 RepID=UPI00311D5F37
MKTPLLFAALASLGLAACGSNDDAPAATPVAPAPTVTVSALEAGSWSVSLGEETAPVVGQYYAASDGTRTLVVDGDDARASALYKGAADGSWKRVPAATADTKLSFLHSASLPLKTLDTAALAGSYVVQVTGTGSPAAAAFSLAADGKISAGNSACKLSGTLGNELVPGVRKLSLTTSACSGLPASLQGIAVADREYAPVVLRFVLDDGSQLAELWAYAE